MYIRRSMEGVLAELAAAFPVVSLSGPRQSGKSTLLKHQFPHYRYLNLEDTAQYQAASVDPVGFLRQNPGPLFIDEAQRVPALFSQIQVESDKVDRPGEYILSGSQNFLLMPSIQQSLAGRVGLLTLLPLSFMEIHPPNGDPLLGPEGTRATTAYMLTGGYPRPYGVKIRNHLFFEAYLKTYVTRDVGEALSVRNLEDFRRFLTVLAHHAGNLVNYTKISSALGIAVETVKAWLSILQASGIVFLLQPYFPNAEKRVVRTPKLYFTDTGLLCHLLQAHTERQLFAHHSLGAIFENLVVSERLKGWLNLGQVPRLYFYRDASKIEVDLVDLTNPEHPALFEVKAGMSVPTGAARHLVTVGEAMGIGPQGRFVIYRGEAAYDSEQARIQPFHTWARTPLPDF